MQEIPLAELRDRVVAVLDRSPLFHGLRPEVLADAADHGDLMLFEDGEAIARQGDPSDSFYLLIDGEASVRLDQPEGSIELARIHPPDAVGEMGVLLGAPRSATVLAAGAAVALRFTSERFHAMLLRLPYFGLVLCRTLAQRLDEANRRIPMPGLEDRQRPGRDVLGLLPGAFQARHRVVPMKLVGNVLTLGFVEAPVPAVLDAVRKHLPGLKLRNVSIPVRVFEEVMQSLSGVSTFEDLSMDEGPLGAGPATPLDALLERMVAEGASDLHLPAGQVPRWRIDGELRRIDDLDPLAPDAVYERLLHPVMSARQRLEFEQAFDTEFTYEMDGFARFRVSLYRDARGASAAIRLVPSRVPSLEQLGLPASVERLCAQPGGLVLVCGPSGSGKSTTLAAMIEHINHTRGAHVITLEQPVEFVHQSARALINQREVGPHAQSLARGIEAALREDPDVLLVGQLRDVDTVRAALEAAATGHLVLAPMWTATVVDTVERLIGRFPNAEQERARGLLARVLKGIVCQTLVRRRGGGRVAAAEVLLASPALAQLVRTGKSGGEVPGTSLDEALALLVTQGLVDREEALPHAADEAQLARRLDGPR